MTDEPRVRIMHVIASLSGYGAEHFVAGLLPLLAAAGAEVGALTLYPPKSAQSNGDLNGVPVFCAGRRRRVQIDFFPRMVRAILSFQPTIVHTHMHNGKYWGRLAAAAARVPCIVHTEHDSNLHRLAIERVADALLLPVTTRFIAFSEDQRERLARADRIPLSRIVVIPNGIVHRPVEPHTRERGRALLGIAPFQRAVMMIGRLEAPKNHELALRAFASLPARLSATTKLCLVGDGSRGEELRAMSEALGIANRVSFFGFRSDAADLLAGADVMLMTSRAEAMPIAIIEAMGVGTPIVSTPWFGVDALLESGRLGYIAADFEPETVALTLAEALRDPEGALFKGQAARRRALARYDLNEAVRRHLDLYRSLLKST